MRPAVAVVLVLAGCGHAAPRDVRDVPFPTLEKDRPDARRVTGTIALRRVAERGQIALELGTNSHALLAFDCADPPPVAPSSPRSPGSSPGSPRRPRLDVPATPRACYRCVLAMDDAGPQNPYGPQPHDASLLMIARTLHRYPPSFVRAARLEALAVCTSIEAPASADLEHLDGLADGHRRRMLVRVADSADRAGVVVHHEIYHLFDEVSSAEVDAPWIALNPRDFTYGVAKATSGFVDDYAQTNAREDKASTFAAMMTEDDFCARAAADPILLGKARLIAERIANRLPRGDAAFVRDRVRCL
ncbi:MAG: hypothetical protein KIT31_14800 [Deltaproteobacteria bacterium]|nr:hypothetical protein [Deltaproteobacteria bacterium]